MNGLELCLAAAAVSFGWGIGSGINRSLDSLLDDKSHPVRNGFLYFASALFFAACLHRIELPF